MRWQSKSWLVDRLAWFCGIDTRICFGEVNMHAIRVAAVIAVGVVFVTTANAQSRPEGAIARLGTVSLRNQDTVRSVALSPDGRLVASVGGSDAIRIWDVRTGLGVATLSAIGETYAIQFSPDGKLLAQVGNGVVRLWSVSDKRQVFESYEQQEVVLGIAFAPQGNVFATAGRDEAIHLWDVATGQLLLRLHSRQTGGSMRGLEFSADGKRLAAGDGRGTIHVWDLSDGSYVSLSDPQIKNPYDASSVHFIDNGQSLLVASQDFGPLGNQIQSRLAIWDLKGGRVIGELSFPVIDMNSQTCVVVSGDGHRAVSCHQQQLAVWDLRSRSLERLIPWPSRHGGILTHGMAIATDGSLIAATADSNKVFLWNADTGEELFRQEDTHFSPLAALQVTPNGRYLVSAGTDGSVHVWNARDYRHEQCLYRNTGPIRDVRVLPDSQQCVILDDTYDRSTGKVSEPVRIVRLSSGRVSQELQLPPRDPGQRIALSADGTTLAVAMRGIDPPYMPNITKVATYDLTRGTRLKTIPCGNDSFVQLAFNTSQDEFLGVLWNAMIQRWQCDTGEALGTIGMEVDSPYAVTPQFDLRQGKILYGGLKSSPRPQETAATIRMTDIVSKEVFWTRREMSFYPVSIAFSPSGHLYAVALRPNAWLDRRAYDGGAYVDPDAHEGVTDRGTMFSNPALGCRIVVGRSSDGVETRTIDIAEGIAGAIAFSPDDEKLFTGMSCGDILVWNTME
ncbi:MAG: WD40 repeat domain-containing protein [Pirellulaceae bacterium]|nr:WD40 repeat domain-containing protein [Planctomycetales bacterium]